MKTTWADPQKQWDGFRLTKYWLDSEKVAALPLVQARQVDGKLEETPTTLGEVYQRLADQRIEIQDGVLEAQITTDAGKESFKGPSFNHRLLRELLKLRKEGSNPFNAAWFFYDHDSCMDDPHETYTFFVVSNEKIVREEVSFSDYMRSGFDPFVFQENYVKSIWKNQDAWSEAGTRYWFQKFYSETRTGQLMVLRDDKPKIYGTEVGHPPEVGYSPEVLLSSSMLRLVNKIHMLLWALVVLMGIILFRLWK